MSEIEDDPWVEALIAQVFKEESEQEARAASCNDGVFPTEDILDPGEIDVLSHELCSVNSQTSPEVDRIYLVLGVRFVGWQEVKDAIRAFSAYSKALEFSELCESYNNSYRNVDDIQDVDEREQLIYELCKIDPAGNMGSQYKRFVIDSFVLN
jgi:hypothetical protein